MEGEGRSVIDLKPFCCTDGRRDIAEPFSTGPWSYAINGHVAVRIPREDDIPKREKQPDAASIFTKYWRNEPFSPLRLILPEAPPCSACSGRKYMHDCPSCRCACHVCDGRKPDDEMTVGMRGANFRAGLVKSALALPGVEFAAAVASAYDPLPFRFADGGQGLLMPYRDKMKNHIDEPAWIAGEIPV